MVVRRLLVVSVALASGACAAIWGFQDAHDLPDGEVIDPDVTPSSTPGFVCAPAPPSAEWQGPLAIYSTTTSADLLDCPAGYASHVDLVGASTTPPIACNCTCTPPATDLCTPPVVTMYSENNCTTPCAAPLSVGETCVGYPAGCAKGTAGKITTPGATNPAAKCTSTSMPDKPPVAFATRSRICAPPPGTNAACPSGKVGVPNAGLQFESNFCIAQTADVPACPPEYPAKRVYHTSFVDKRDCTCGCGPLANADCTYDVNARDMLVAPSCGGPTHPFSATCSGGTGNGLALVAQRTGTSPGACPATGGAVGDVELDNLTTVCCRH